MIFFTHSFHQFIQGAQKSFSSKILALQSCLNLNDKKGSCIRGLTQDPFSCLFLLKQPCCSLICLPQIRPVRIRHRSHDFATQCSHFVDIELGGWLKWLPLNCGYNDVMHTAPILVERFLIHREVVEEIECCLSPGKSCFCEFELTVRWNVNYQAHSLIIEKIIFHHWTKKLI